MFGNVSTGNDSDSGVILAEFVPVQAVCLLFSLASLLLLIFSKAYKDFLHRLLCYLSSFGVLWMCFLSVSLLLFNNYNVKFLFVASRAVYCYASLVYCLLLFWISIYLFVLAVFGAQLNKTKHEVIGLTIVLVTPLFFVWVARVPSYVTRCIHCLHLRLLSRGEQKRPQL